MTPLLMALAGGLGAGTRWTIDSWARPRSTGAIAWATIAINISGSLLLGLLVGLGTGDTWRTVVGTGFLGGYTTFSAASTEAARLALDRRHVAAAGYATATLVISVAAAALGYALGRGV
ncbi:MAG: chromosome condensation protein CrcB [Aeromicrobium sp.]|nr:chromosome condensation protein CrcB [Aeromicrobium sp.]